MKRLGIPYAWVEVDDRGAYRICPACGEHVRERTDVTGELTTNAYGEHYAAEHDEEER